MPTSIAQLTFHSAFAATQFDHGDPLDFHKSFIGENRPSQVRYYEASYHDQVRERMGAVTLALSPRDDTAFPDVAVSLDRGETFSSLINPEWKIGHGEDDVVRADIMDAAVSGLLARVLVLSKPQNQPAKKLGLLWGAVTVIDENAPDTHQRVVYAALRRLKHPFSGGKPASPEAVRERHSLFYPAPHIPERWTEAGKKRARVKIDPDAFATATFMRESAALLAEAEFKDHAESGCLFLEAAMYYHDGKYRGHVRYCLEQARKHFALADRDCPNQDERRILTKAHDDTVQRLGKERKR